MQDSGISQGETRSSLLSRNITVMGKRTSVRLELEMWNALKEIARRENCSIHDICSLISMRRGNSSLTAAIRVFLMLYFRSAATEEGHARAGHGRFEKMVERARLARNSAAANQDNAAGIRKPQRSSYLSMEKAGMGGDSTGGESVAL